MASSNFLKIDDNFSVDGVLTDENLAYLKENFNSILYLSCDTETDKGAPDGFASAQRVFSDAGSAIHIVSNVGSIGLNEESDLHNVMVQFCKYERALDSLPRPTAVCCKTSRRAGAVVAAYIAYKSGMNSDALVSFATEKNLSFLAHPALSRWARMVSDHGVKTNSRGRPQACSLAIKPLIFRQLYEAESSTYTFLLADPVSGEAVLIDPVLETVERDAQSVRDLNLTLKYVINTHCHADHITGTGQLKGLFPDCRSMIAEASGAVADIKLNHGDLIHFGDRYLKCLATPGHTPGCISYLLDDLSAVFTGDAVLYRGCGRTDFQGGSAQDLYRSVHANIFSLPDQVIIYPAHDYKGQSASSVGEERRLNPRLTKSEEGFIEFMGNLNLPYPKKIDASLPRNLLCGL